MNVSCNLLNTVLKMDNRMAVHISVVYPGDCVADWELQWLPLPSITREHACTSLAQEEIQVPSAGATECIVHWHRGRVKTLGVEPS